LFEVNEDAVNKNKIKNLLTITNNLIKNGFYIAKNDTVNDNIKDDINVIQDINSYSSIENKISLIKTQISNIDMQFNNKNNKQNKTDNMQDKVNNKQDGANNVENNAQVKQNTAQSKNIFQKIFDFCLNCLSSICKAILSYLQKITPNCILNLFFCENLCLKIIHQVNKFYLN